MSYPYQPHQQPGRPPAAQQQSYGQPPQSQIPPASMPTGPYEQGGPSSFRGPLPTNGMPRGGAPLVSGSNAGMPPQANQQFNPLKPSMPAPSPMGAHGRGPPPPPTSMGAPHHTGGLQPNATGPNPSAMPSGNAMMNPPRSIPELPRGVPFPGQVGMPSGPPGPGRPGPPPNGFGLVPSLPPPPASQSMLPQQLGGYPPQSVPPGYPPQCVPPGYPPQSMPPGYPPQGVPPGYPPQSMPPGYPPQNMQPPQTGGYPPQTGSGPPQQGSYPSQQDAPGQQMARDPRQRIDPNQIPRPPIVKEIIRYHARGHTMTIPPPASADFIVTDDGCCSARFIRPTLNHIPATKELDKQCGIPMATIICPLAIQRPEEPPIPVVDFGTEGPLRCNRCNAYINCFMSFVQGGRKFVCNICGMPNDTPRDYFCNVDEFGQRRDARERPELCKGSVEFVVPPAYSIRSPQEPIYVFVVEASVFSSQCGLLRAVLDNVKECILDLPEPERSRIGIITFNKQVHYYHLELSKLQVLMCPDVDDPFSPLPSKSWLTPLSTCLEKIDEVCTQILSSFEQTKISDAVTGAALYSACEGLKDSGGKIMMFMASTPGMGKGRVKRDEVMGNYGTESERPMYIPDAKDDFYKNLAADCSKNQISVDIFVAGNAYSDLATVGQVCNSTGGSVYYCPYFGQNLVEDTAQLKRDIDRTLSKTLGFEAVLKIRCSAGIRVKEYYGHFMNRTGLELEMAAVDCDKAVVVTYEHDDDLKEGKCVYIQAALLYTTIEGKRSVRIHNLALPVAPLLSNVFRYADLEATCGVYQRQAAKLMLSKNTTQTKEEIVNNCVNVLYNYRKYCASASSSGQLILPESLKLLPLYTLATMKSPALRANLAGTSRGQVDIRADERSVLLTTLYCSPVEHAVWNVYPKLYSLHNMPTECGTIGDDGRVVLPDIQPPTSEKLLDDGIFLLSSATTLQLFIGDKADPQLLQQLFGVEKVDSSEKAVNLVSQNMSDLRARVQEILDYVRAKSFVQQPLEIITKNDWRCGRFMSSLIEDRTRNDISYVEFLCQIHKMIQTKFH